jgi:4-diphosphocytidyl-2-C-methyl-D-erythritol kinase
MARIHESHLSSVIILSSPAKINLTLEVLGKRPDGYHEIRSVMQTISLSDTLSFKASERFEIASDNPEWEGSKSLVSQAANLLKEKTGFAQGASIFVQKRIPWFSGLGGDSSNAAATLIGLNKLWGVDLNREELLSMGRELGSDVGFFFYGGTALATGRGEIITPLPPILHRWIVLLIPEVSRMTGKTRLAYQSIKPSHYTDGQLSNKLVTSLNLGENIDESLMFNVFVNAVFPLQPGLEMARRHLLKMGASNVHLAGSGIALFSILDDYDRAKNLFSKLEKQGSTCYLAETI